MSGYARAAADLNLAEAGRGRGRRGRRDRDGRDGRRRRAAVPRLAAPHPAPLGGRARRGDVAGRPGRALAAGPAGQVVVTSRLRAQELAEPGARADRLRGHRVQPARGGRLPQHPAGQLPRPADRGARPGRGHRGAAARDRAGGGGDHRGRGHLPGVPGRVRAAAADERAPRPSTAARGRCSATWSLAVEYAHEMPPAGLAWPALAFAAMLDASGIPAAVLTAPAACAYITGRPEAGAAEQNLVRTAYDALERLGLAAVDATSTARTVWLHSSVRVLRPRLPDPRQHRLRWCRRRRPRWPRRGRRSGARGRNSARRCGTARPRCTPSRATCCGSRRPIRRSSGPGRR